MAERTDARVRRTRELLGSAAVALVAERDPADISITDITARAGVSRPTFYLHYQDRDQLFAAVLRDRLDRLLAAHPPMESLCEHEVPPQLRELLDDVADNPMLYRRLAGTDLAGPARRVVADYLHQLTRRYVERAAIAALPGVQTELLVSYIAGGVAGALSNWIDSDEVTDHVERERFAAALWQLIAHTGQ